jgi:sensor histidine kinase YesM
MIKGRFNEYLTHPGFISLFLWALVFPFVPPLFTKYRVTHISDEYTNLKNRYYYFDLDGDQKSEKILVDFNETQQTKIQVFKGSKIHDQYDLKFLPCSGHCLAAEDYDADGNSELYLFTQSTDSIFLNIIDPIVNRRVMVSTRFIDLRRIAPQSDDSPEIEPIGLMKDTKGNCSGFLFYINTGYSLQPRNVYKYCLREDTLIRSAESSESIIGCLMADINMDSVPELLPQVLAPGNHGQDAPYSDQYTWLMVMDNNLNFLFKPVRFAEHPSRLLVMPLKTKSHYRIIVLQDYFGTGNYRSSFYRYDSHGNKLYEKPVAEMENVHSGIFQHADESSFFFLKNRRAEVVELDSNFNELNTLKLPGIESGLPFALLDANLDGTKEYFFMGARNRSMVIVQANFKHPVTWDHDMSPAVYYVSMVLNGLEKPMVYLQSDDHGTYIRYERNPVYYLRFPFYLTSYLVILLFIFLIARMQRYRLRIHQETEKRMAALQLKAIKNQINPHFTLNILNAIGSLYATDENRDKADYIFGKYARLIRQTVISSDEIIISLADELDFVKNYIELEQFRCDYSFDYTLEIDEKLDLQIKIPRMLIYTFVENAIKYGIRAKKHGSKLTIGLQALKDKCRIIVEDNGPGLAPDGKSENGTGKGLVILKDLVDLYYKLEKVRIGYSLQTIGCSQESASGTRAVIEIFQ